jgi:predicted nucleotidyltransferase
MSKFQQILDSFSVRETLNPKIWESPDDPQKATMIPKVHKGLMRIAQEFIDYLGDEVFVEDIVLTGSLANFNWSEFSDFDLHVIIDFQQYEDEATLYKELFNLKKQIFNDKHDIKIFGYDVELYSQDSEEPHFASGVYSVMNNEWIDKPKKFKNEIDKVVLEKKIKNWTEKIDKVIASKDTQDDQKTIDLIKDKLKDYRKSGLEKEGELSYENLVFKFLRRSGHIQKLFDSSNKALDKELSIERKLEETYQ